MAGYDEGLQDRGLETGSGFEWIKVTSVTQDFLNTLSVAPALGREFNADETRRGGPQAIILSERLWQRAADHHTSVTVNRKRSLGGDRACYPSAGGEHHTH
jgi:hypothetical protein